jgi:WD40 repeat protein
MTTRIQSRVLPDELIAVVLSFLPVNVLLRADMVVTFEAFYDTLVVRKAVRNGRWLAYERGLIIPDTFFKGDGVSSLVVESVTGVLISGHSSSIRHWCKHNNDGRPVLKHSTVSDTNKNWFPKIATWKRRIIGSAPNEDARRLTSIIIGHTGKSYTTVFRSSVIYICLPASTKTDSAIEGHTEVVNMVVVGRNINNNVYSGSDDGTVRVWSGDTDTHIATLATKKTRKHKIVSLAIGADGKVYAGTANGMIHVWSGSSTDPHHQYLYTLVGRSARVHAIVVDREGRVFSTVGNDIWMWQGRTRSKTLRGHTGAVTSLALNSNGDLYSGSMIDKTIREW